MRQLRLHTSLALFLATLAKLYTVVAAETGACHVAGNTGAASGCAPAAQGGIALLAVHWRRTTTETHVGSLDASNDDFVPHGPCSGRGCGGTHVFGSEALIAAPEAPAVGANLTATSGREHSSSYSLSSAGQGGGLSSNAAAGLQDAAVDNMSRDLPPIAQERYEPFGYPGAGLLLELHLPEITLRELHSSSRGSLAQFLLEVRAELCKGAKVNEQRISILGIHGRYKRYNSGGLFHIHSERASHSEGGHVDEEVVVRFEILPGWDTDPDPRQALDVLRDDLSSSGGGLSGGPLGTALVNASVTVSAPAGIASQPRMVEHRGMAHMSAMAWPIGISAAFIGILIWLAAY